MLLTWFINTVCKHWIFNGTLVLCTCFHCFIILIYAQVSQKKTLDFFFTILFSAVYLPQSSVFVRLINRHLAQQSRSWKKRLILRGNLRGLLCLSWCLGWPGGRYPLQNIAVFKLVIPSKAPSSPCTSNSTHRLIVFPILSLPKS